MSGCGCKTNSNNNLSEDKKALPTKNYFIKILLFIMLVLMSPVFLGLIMWVLFRTLIMDKELDILPLILKLIGKDKNKEEIDDEDDIDENDIDENDVIAINVEDITNKYK